MKILRDYQEETVDILADGGLNASGLGAGKTLTSVEACRLLSNLGRVPRILVISPTLVRNHWMSTFIEQFPSLGAKDAIHVVGTHRKDPENWARMTRKRPGVYIIGWNAMHGGVPEQIRRDASNGRNANAKNPKVTMASARKAIAAGKVPPWTRTGVWDLVIMDEVHRANNRQGVPFHVLKLIKGTKKIGLSATPAGDHPKNLWAILNILWPDRYGAFWDWAENHFHIDIEVVRGAPSPIRKIGKERFPGATWKNIPAVVRYRTEDVYDQLPPVIARKVSVPMASLQEAQYLDFQEQSLAWLSGVPVGTPLPIAQRIRLRQAALGTLKAEEIVRRKFQQVPERDLAEFLRSAINPKVHRPKGWTPNPCDVNKHLSRFFRNATRGMEVNVWVKDVTDFNFNESPSIPLSKALTVRAFGNSVNRTGEDSVRVSHEVEELDISFEETTDQPKLEAVKEILADLPPGEPLLVWTHSAKWARMAEKALGKQAASWTMKTTASKRKKIEAGFGVEYRVLFAQLQSLSEGVDWLKDACRCEVFASTSEWEVMNQQAEGRLHRPGQKSPVQRWMLITEGTIDDDVNLSNLLKRDRTSIFYGDKREESAA